MNNLKRVFLVFCIFSLLVLLLSLVFPSTISIERSIHINAPVNSIYKQIEALENRKNWSEWVLKDINETNSKGSDTEASGTSSVYWNSDDEGFTKGKIKTIENILHEKVVFELKFSMFQPHEVWQFNDLEDEIEVKRQLTFDLGYHPIKKFYGLFLERLWGPLYDSELKNLKSYAEQLPKIHEVEVSRDVVEPILFLSIRDTLHPDKMNNIHGKMYEIISNFIAERSFKIQGSPLVIYHFWSDTLIDIEAGIPIAEQVSVDHESIRFNMIPKGNVVKAIHDGPYERMPETYFGINEWMRKNKVTVQGPPWEVYLTDPAEELNPEQWKTAVYFPINEQK